MIAPSLTSSTQCMHISLRVYYMYITDLTVNEFLYAYDRENPRRKVDHQSLDLRQGIDSLLTPSFHAV